MRRWTLMLSLAALLLGCNQESSTPDLVTPPTDPQPTMGELHNEFLEILYTRFHDQKSKSGPLSLEAYRRILITTVAEISDAYNVPRMSEAEIFAAVQQGQNLARQDPSALVNAVLSPEERVWWERFASQATVETARETYADHVKRFGAPPPGSVLQRLVDVAVHSAVFWRNLHADDEPLAPGATPRSWRKRALRFVTVVVVDGVSGGLAGGGGGGLVGGAIVGGLASHGADCVLFGC